MSLPTLDMVTEEVPGLFSGYVGRFSHDMRIHFTTYRHRPPSFVLFIGNRFICELEASK